MPQLDGYEYVPFPFDLLSPQSGELTWIKEFEDSPVEGAVFEFPVPYVPLEADEEYWSVIDPECGTTLTLEAPLPFLKSQEFARRTFDAEGSNLDAFNGSVYLGDRHHPIDLYSLAFENTESGLLVTIDCLVLFTMEGLGAGDDVEFDDTRWRFSAHFAVKEEVHNYRAGKSPSMIGRLIGFLRRE